MNKKEWAIVVSLVIFVSIISSFISSKIILDNTNNGFQRVHERIDEIKYSTDQIKEDNQGKPIIEYNHENGSFGYYFGNGFLNTYYNDSNRIQKSFLYPDRIGLNDKSFDSSYDGQTFATIMTPKGIQISEFDEETNIHTTTWIHNKEIIINGYVCKPKEMTIGNITFSSLICEYTGESISQYDDEGNLI